MPICRANDLDIYYEQVGEPSHSPLLLISGLGAQITGWHEKFLARMATAGFFVTVFDNRDVGYSSWLDHLGTPDVDAILSGAAVAPYFLADMAADGAALVRELELGPVHVVGVSMGGMIAQQFAIDFPDLTRSLTSIMSTPYSNEVGQPTPEALAMLMRPRSDDFEQFMVEELESWRVTGGGTYPLDESWIRDSVKSSWTRGRNPVGVTRHLAAIVQSPDRRPLLSSVVVPSLVVHGEADPLVTPSGGEATAAALPNGTYVSYPGMGHSLPEELWDDVIGQIHSVSQRA